MKHEQDQRGLQSRVGEQHYRLLVESVRDYAIFMLDPAGRIESWNAGAEQIKGYRADEIVGKHFSVFYPEDAQASGWPAEELRIALRDGRMEDQDWRVRKDGTRFWANVVITPLHDEAGTHLGFAKVTRDLTDQLRVKALEDEGRRMTTFLAMLGHELRNPLAPIANAVSVMQLEEIASENMRRCRDIIARQLTQLTRLVNDLLDVGRITSGKVRLEMEPVDLRAIVREAAEMVEPLALARSQLLTVDVVGDGSWRVDGDHARLVQVFSNLLTNAVKFTQEGGKIGASLLRSGDQAEISVKDNGPGIAPSRLSDVFNLFVQGEEQPEQLGGLGLGLSLVQQLVSLHGGDVGAFSTGIPGKGTEFIVRLPLLRDGGAEGQ